LSVAVATCTFEVVQKLAEHLVLGFFACDNIRMFLCALNALQVSAFDDTVTVFVQTFEASSDHCETAWVKFLA
jgi:hypothetical protein